MPTPFGTTTAALFLKLESHKLFEEFTVAAAQTVKKGQQITQTVTGTVQPIAAASAPHLVIGIAMNNAAAGEVVTVMLKAYAIVYCESNAAATNAGPVKWAAWNSTTLLTEVSSTSVDATNIMGWAIDAGAADGSVVRVAMYS
jgi:hypothetical protein